MPRTIFKGFLFILFLLVVITAAGCVTVESGPQVKEEYVFFPSPPDLPRFQFLTAFRGADDFKEETSGLDKLLGVGLQSGYRLKKPYGVAMYGQSMYVVDTMSSVWRFDFEKRKITTIQGDKGLGKLITPINIKIDAEGNKYVSDSGRGAVLMYDKNDFFVKAYTAPGQWKPVDMDIYENQLFVVDATHNKGGIKVFDIETGELLETIGQSGPPEQRCAIPQNLAIDKDGYLYVMDAGRFQILRYDRDGHYRGHLGGPGSSPGFFGRPRGLDLDNQGRIYAVDGAFDVVQLFSPTGQVLGILGGPGTTPGTLTLPAGVYITYDHFDIFEKFVAPGFEIEYLVFVTSQFHNTNAVSVYGFGKQAGVQYPTDDELLDEVREELENRSSN